MPDVFTKSKRSEVMSRVRSRGNKDTELALARLLRTNRISGWRRQQEVRIQKSESGFSKSGRILFSGRRGSPSSWTDVSGMAAPGTARNPPATVRFGKRNSPATKPVTGW